eukprot:Hpha_TRINITY_DN16296_c2_g14::TRINITY_DN16296_c2_g14_i1::g.11386::m.11386
MTSSSPGPTPVPGSGPPEAVKSGGGGRLYEHPLQVLAQHYAGNLAHNTVCQSAGLPQRTEVSVEEVRSRRKAARLQNTLSATSVPRTVGRTPRDPRRCGLPPLQSGRSPTPRTGPLEDSGIWTPPSPASRAADWGLWSSRPEEECGMDHVVGSLERLIPRVEREGFDEKWKAVGDWIEKYSNSREDNNVAVHAAKLLGIDLAPPSADDDYANKWPPRGPPRRTGPLPKQARGATVSGSLPSRARISTAVVVLDVLLSLIARSSPVMSQVAREVRSIILQAVFAGCGDSEPDGAVHIPDLTGDRLPKEEVDDAREAYRRTRQPFCGLVDGLRKKLGIMSEEIEGGDRKAERLLGVMDRGMAYWKGHLKSCILKAWSQVAKNRKREELMLKKQVEVETQRAKLEINLARATEKLQTTQRSKTDEVTRLTSELEDEKKARVTTESEARKVMEESEQVLREARDDGSRKVAELTADMDIAVQDRDAMSQLCRDITVCCLEGHPAESAVVAQCMPPGEVSVAEAGLEDTLCFWLNAVVERSGVPDAGQYKIKSMHDGIRLFIPYVMAAHFMAPTAVPRVLVDHAISPQTVQERAQRAIHAARMAGVSVSFDAATFAKPDSVRFHIVFASQLFARYTDPPSAGTHHSICVPQPLRPPSDHPLWKGPLPADASRWRERAQKAWERCCQLRASGAAIQGKMISSLLDMAAGGAKAAKPLDEGQRLLYVDAPLTLIEGDDTVPEAEVAPLRELLQQYCITLRSIFRYYATSDTRQVDESLSTDEIWKLLSDCRMTANKDPRNGISRGTADEIVGKAGKGKDGLGPTDFVRFLMRLAAVRIKGTSQLSDKLRTLLEKTVIRNANYSDTTEFLTSVYSPEVQGVLVTNKDWAQACFRAYCKAGAKGWLAQGKGKMEDRRMYIDDFVQLTSDMTLTDSVLTQQSIRQIFLQTVLSDEQSSDGSSEMGLTYQQFLECICVLAAFKSPLPYFPLSKRLARFFDVWWTPLLADVAKFKKVHDEYGQIMKSPAAAFARQTTN